jgi:hypothetical protein
MLCFFLPSDPEQYTYIHLFFHDKTAKAPVSSIPTWFHLIFWTDAVDTLFGRF